MRKILLLIALCACSIFACAQSVNDNADAYVSEIGRKARLFCKYVMAVGNTAGQKGAVSEAQKRDIIYNRVPSLFWNYFEDPRYMRVTNGRNGQFVRKKKMHNYFLGLRSQAKSLAEPKVYELRYTGMLPGGKGIGKTFSFKKTLSDGSKLYSSKAQFDQIYHTVRHTPEATIITEEHDIKILEVFVIEKPSGKTNVYLGDVTQAVRIK